LARRSQKDISERPWIPTAAKITIGIGVTQSELMGKRGEATAFFLNFFNNLFKPLIQLF
jgi:hypothetical protein